MRQPSTGVCGESDMAIFSSLLNISDSVPPTQARSAATSHFLRDLGGTRKGRLCLQHLPYPSLHPERGRFSLPRSRSLDLAQILQGNPAVLGPVHREDQLLHQPLALLRQPVPGGSVAMVVPVGLRPRGGQAAPHRQDFREKRLSEAK